MQIDAHQHFWSYRPAELPWIGESMAAIRRDFLPADLKPQLDACHIDGTIAVQTRGSLDETRWLIEQAAEHPFIKGVVGWMPLTDPLVKDHLETLAHCHTLKGIRLCVNDEADDFLAREDINSGVNALGDFWLTIELFALERQLQHVIPFADRHPYQTIVLDHFGMPEVRKNSLESWAASIHSLAERGNVYCKLSGILTQADWHAWNEHDLTRYWEVVLSAFSPRRIMWGSDWPTCLLAATYRDWYDLCRRFTSALSVDEQQQIFGGTALEAYRISAVD